MNTKYELLFENIENIKLKGLTKNTIKCLKKLNIDNIYKLMYYFPRTYENSASFKKIFNVLNEESVVLKGKVISCNRRRLATNRYMFTANLSDETGVIELIWFNNNFIHHSIKIGDELVVTGKVKKTIKAQIINPSYKKSNVVDEMYKESFLEPIYPLTKGLTQKKLSNLMKEAINKYGYLLQENIPLDFLYDNKIISRQKALANIHFPTNENMLNLSIRRFTYEEIIILETFILKKKFLNIKENINIYNINDNKELVKKYISELSFELTNAQKKVIASIYKEIKTGKIINRLIQGDVGSGKTIVALIIMLFLAENNYQTVLMAPTEILATQHYNNIKEQFKNLNIRVELLTSSIKGKNRAKLLEDIKNGDVHIVIGTHSLIQDDIIFRKLGLCVIDEQHKFGVEQRNKLREKALFPNIIVMSATPIPRSLALTIYGDLDVSIIDEMPKGRQKVKTKWIKNNDDILKMYDFVEKKLQSKKQVYIVSPIIENSKIANISSAKEIYEEIKEIFSKYSVGLLHGKLTNKEKDTIMNDFKEHKIDILVSTTVIEVGVDVSNANIIIIKNAERFGLSSLHQLRGRVGRSNEKAYCFLVSFTDNEISQKRLTILENENNGFKIAEEDLKLRNSGEIFGIKQSGLPDLILLDIIKNIKEIEEVKNFIKKYLTERNGIIDNPYLLRDIQEKQNTGENR